MDIQGLLTEFQRIGLIVELGSVGKLRINGPAHPEAALLIAALTKHKAQVIAALSAPVPSLPPLAEGYERIPLEAGEEPFLIEAPHDLEDWKEPNRNERWADKRQLAQTAADLVAQQTPRGVAYRMAIIAGYTAKEAGYIAKLMRDGDWRKILEEKYTMPRVDKLAALLVAA